MNATAMTDRRAELDDLSDRFVCAFNRQNLDDIMSYFKDDAVYEDLDGKKHETLNDIRAQFDVVVGGSSVDHSKRKIASSTRLPVR